LTFEQGTVKKEEQKMELKFVQAKKPSKKAAAKAAAAPVAEAMSCYL